VSKGLESSHSPYSKSHTRRLKRKAKQQIAGGLGDMQAAISALEKDLTPAEMESTASQTLDEQNEQKPKAKVRPGQIGEGRPVPLSKAQRKRAL
jgi:ribosome biogenesis protein SLX9